MRRLGRLVRGSKHAPVIGNNPITVAPHTTAGILIAIETLDVARFQNFHVKLENVMLFDKTKEKMSDFCALSNRLLQLDGS